jgi:Protein of unknown function (DUF2505)
MRFQISHQFDGIGPDAYAALYFDESFSAALGRELRLGRELIRLDRSPTRVVRHVRSEPDREPDTPAGQALGQTRASYVEELDFDLRARRGTWRTVPNLIPERVRTEGTLEIVAAPRGATRIVRGEVDVRLFGFGRLIEKHVVAEIEKSYAGAAAFTASWIAQSNTTVGVR